MLDKEQVQLSARLLALEHFVTSFVVTEMYATGWGDQQVADLVQTFTDQARTASFGGKDPAESDLLAAEYEDAVRALLAMLMKKRSLTPKD